MPRHVLTIFARRDGCAPCLGDAGNPRQDVRWILDRPRAAIYNRAHD